MVAEGPCRSVRSVEGRVVRVRGGGAPLELLQDRGGLILQQRERGGGAPTSDRNRAGNRVRARWPARQTFLRSRSKARLASASAP